MAVGGRPTTPPLMRWPAAAAAAAGAAAAVAAATAIANADTARGWSALSAGAVGRGVQPPGELWRRQGGRVRADPRRRIQ